MSFYHMRFPTTITFGAGSLRMVGRKLKDNSKRKPLVVTDKSLASLPLLGNLLAFLDEAKLSYEVYSEAEGNPKESHVLKGVKAYLGASCDSVISLGGGCALDVGKAVALMSTHEGQLFDYEDGLVGASPIEDKIPFSIAIPTTAGTGSEVCGSSVISKDEDGKKVIIWSPYLIPHFVIADPCLTVSLPKEVTASTGMDALIHNIEAFLVNTIHPLADGIALEGIRLVKKSLVTCFREPENVEARGDMLLASLMGATAFQKGLGVTHSCAHALSQCFDLHHGLANALMLMPCMKFNLDGGSRERFARMGHTIGIEGSDNTKVEGFLSWLSDLKKELGLDFGLKEVGVQLSEDLYEKAFQDTCHLNNPRKCDVQDFRSLFEQAY